MFPRPRVKSIKKPWGQQTQQGGSYEKIPLQSFRAPRIFKIPKLKLHRTSTHGLKEKWVITFWIKNKLLINTLSKCECVVPKLKMSCFSKDLRSSQFNISLIYFIPASYFLPLLIAFIVFRSEVHQFSFIYN